MYISIDAAFRPDLIGNVVIEGWITNNSPKTFKDPIINVRYISKTGSTIGSRNYTIYDYLPPGISVKLKEKERSYRKSVSFYHHIVDAPIIN